MIGLGASLLALASCDMPPEIKEPLYDRSYDALPQAKHMEAATAEAIEPYNFPQDALDETQKAGDALREK